MGKETRLDREYKHYLESGVWKCPFAPVNTAIPLQVRENSGAHYWIGKWFGGDVGYAYYCKYCFDVRKFPTIITKEESIKLGQIPY